MSELDSTTSLPCSIYTLIYATADERSDAGAAAVSELAKVTSGLMGRLRRLSIVSASAHLTFRTAARAHVHEAQDSEAERRIYEAGKVGDFEGYMAIYD